MRVLVTGGRGFIGNRLVKALIQKGCQVDVLSRIEGVCTKVNKASVYYVCADLLDNEFDFEGLVSQYSVIFNCAGELHEEAVMFSLHVRATERLVSACKTVSKAQKRPIHWVQLSSVGAYGSCRPKKNGVRIVTEKTLPSPEGEYEVTKTLADEIFTKAENDPFFSYSILRPSNVYGSGMPNNSIRQLGMMIKKKLFFYIGRSGAISNYIHVDDVVDALILCGFDPRAKGEIFNVSNDCELNIVINSLARFLNVSVPSMRVNEYFARSISFAFSWLKIFPLTASRIDALTNRTEYSNKKIISYLGFRPSRDIEKTIVEVLVDSKGVNDGRF